MPLTNNNTTEPQLISRRRFLQTASGVAAGTILAPSYLRGEAPSITRPSRGPNIVYFVTHDLGKHCSLYGVPVPTPNLDALGAEGIVMDNAFCTSPPCSPSRGCVMSGHYPHRNELVGVTNYDWQLGTNVPNIVEIFNANGYETASAGFTHERKGGPKAMGYQKLLRHRGGMADNFIENAIDDSIGYLEKRRPGDKPFYLNIGTMETHPTQWSPYNLRMAEEFGRGAAKFGVDEADETYIPPEVPDIEYTREMMRHFAPCIRYMDTQLARMIEAVTRMDDAENTLFIFTTDHGIFASRGKGTAYTHGMEIATVFHQPGRLQGGQRNRDLFNNIDFFPTLLECAGIEAPPNYGHSHWRGLVGDSSHTPQEHIFTERNYHENYDPVRTVRTNEFHYLRNFHPFAKKYLTPAEIIAAKDPVVPGGWGNDALSGPDNSSKALEHWPNRDREELFDIVNDPYETRNLAGDPKYADVKARLARLCDEHMAATNDPLLRGPIRPTRSQFEAIKKRTPETVGPPLEEILGYV